MAYSFDNRVKFIVRYMYDIDNNGILDKNDFECMALRATIIEKRGEFDQAAFEANQKAMRALWKEFSDFADFDKDGQVTVDEFKQAIKKSIVGKKYSEFPPSFRYFITLAFKNVDLNGDGVVGIDEYRLDAISRFAYQDVKEIDDAFNKLLSEEDRKVGGLTISRYEELYAQFLSSEDDSNPAVHLFGPLQVQ